MGLDFRKVLLDRPLAEISVYLNLVCQFKVPHWLQQVLHELEVNEAVVALSYHKVMLELVVTLYCHGHEDYFI